MIGTVGKLGARMVSSGLSRFIPEPRNRNQGSVSSIGGGFGSLLNGAASSFDGGAANYEALLETQQRLNFQNLFYSTVSNTRKSEHDTRMSISRNMRVS